MADLGDPISYLEMPTGVPVYSADGEKLGRVEQVLSAPEADIFDGLVVSGGRLRGRRFVDAPEVAALHVRGAVLTLTAEQAAALPAPRGASSDGLGVRLRRAWEAISRRG